MKTRFRQVIDNHFFREKTFRKWFYSSMCVILVFIFSGIALYLNALHVTRKIVVMAQERNVEQTVNLLNNKLLSIERGVAALAYNPRILSTSYIEPPFTGLDFYNLHKTGNELVGLYLYGSVQDIHIYYTRSSCFVGVYSLAYTNMDTYTQANFKMEFPQWKSFASGQMTSSFSKKGDSIYFFCPLKRNGEREIISLAVATLDMDELVDIIHAGSSETTGEGYSYIVNRSGEVIVTAGNVPGEAAIFDGLAYGENYLGQMVVIAQSLHYSEWDYVSVIPLQHYLEEVYSMRRLLYLYIAFCICAGIGIVYVETKKRYGPVHALNKKIPLAASDTSTDTSIAMHGDIFIDLQNKINDLLRDNSVLHETSKKGKEALLIQQLIEIIDEKARGKAHKDIFKEHFSVGFRQGVVSIAEVMLLDEEGSSITREELDTIVLICLNNIVAELLGGGYRCYFWKRRKLTGIIWTENAQDISIEPHIQNIFSQTGTYMKLYFNMDIRFTVSKECNALSTLGTAFQQAELANDYCNITEKRGVVVFEESFNQPLPEWKDMDILKAEQDFTTSMIDRDYARAKNTLSLIIGYYKYTDGASIQIMKCRMFGLINLVLNAIVMEKTGEEELFYKEINPVQRLLEAATIYSLEGEIIDIIEAMIKRYNIQNQTLEQKIESIDRYIEYHYMDQGLSVQHIADHFKISVSYLSKAYKEQKDYGVLESINYCRIKVAKELLLQQSAMPLHVIAERVGYSNVHTFLRVFKKLENQTPGQYREAKRKSIQIDS